MATKLAICAWPEDLFSHGTQAVMTEYYEKKNRENVAVTFSGSLHE